MAKVGHPGLLLRTFQMYISIGWYCVVGGIWGTIQVALTKKFFRSDFANQEGVIKAEDYTTDVPVSPLTRWVIVGICIFVIVLGLFLIQHDQNWNPF